MFPRSRFWRTKRTEWNEDRFRRGTLASIGKRSVEVTRRVSCDSRTAKRARGNRATKLKGPNAVNVHARSDQPGGSNLPRICAAHFLPSLARRPLSFPPLLAPQGFSSHSTPPPDSTILSTFFSLLFFPFLSLSLFFLFFSVLFPG